MRIDVKAVPLLPGVRALVPGNVPAGGRTNAEHFASGLFIERDIPEDLVTLLHDPQTSGGLLVAVGEATSPTRRRPSRPPASAPGSSGRLSRRLANDVVMR